MRAAAALLLLLVAVEAVPARAPQGSPRRPLVKPPVRPLVGVRQQGDEFVDPDVLKEVFTSTPPSPLNSQRQGQDAVDDKEALSPEFICSIFGGPSCPTDGQPTIEPCLCDSNEACQCVPYYQCDKDTGSYNEFGVGVIDIRQGNTTCGHYLNKCCKPADKPRPPPGPYTPEGPPTPEPPGDPSPPPYDPYPPGSPSTGPVNPDPDLYPPPSPGPDPGVGPDPGAGPDPDPYPQQQPPPPPQGPADPPPPVFTPVPPSGPTKCGVRNPEGIGVRITGDEDGEAQFGEFPWMVAILKVETSEDDKKRNLYQCGGALITPQVVLTAAHCVKKSSPRQLKVRAGEWDTQTSKEMYRHQDVAVEDVAIHPEYYAGAVHNDVALLYLNDPVLIGYHIGTICMPEQDQNFDYNKCFVSGWGKDKFGQQGRYQVILKKLELPIVPNDECQEQLRKTRLGLHFTLHDSFLCAGGEEGKDTCKGDGGSPLVCPMPGHPGRYQLAGTVAWGIDCGLAGVPGVYGRVSKFRTWVDDELRAHHIDDTAYLP